MNHLDLFSGIGGFTLAASWVWGEEHKIVSFIEVNLFCQKVLRKYWPNVTIISDIRDYKCNNEKIDLLTGGFPCQPFSQAGKRKGKKDDRYLWPEMLRIIRETKPTWIIGENVTGILSMVEWNKEIKVGSQKRFCKTKGNIYQREGAYIFFGKNGIIENIEQEGYSVEVFVLPACSVNAPHKRDRVWIVANFRGQSNYIKRSIYKNNIFMEERGKKDNLNIWSKYNRTYEFDIQKQSNVTFESIFCRKNDGVSSRVDRLRSLGNAIVPQVVVPIMEAIKEIEKGN